MKKALAEMARCSAFFFPDLIPATPFLRLSEDFFSAQGRLETN